MNLYFQIFTQSQSDSALGLLKFMSFFAPRDLSGGKGVMSSGGNTVSFSYQNFERLQSKVAQRRFNQFQINCGPVGFDVGTTNAKVRSVTGVFTPSASSDLWFSSKNWPTGGERQMRTRKMNAKTKEGALEVYGVKKPALFELVLEIETPLRSDVIFGNVAQNCLTRPCGELLALKPFGCGDAGGPEYFVKMEAGVIMTEEIRVMAKLCASAYPLLGERFDKLHPFMFGDLDLCRNIVLGAGDAANLITVDEKGKWGGLYFNEGADLLALNKNVSQWLVPESN
jgi:hypothetical protein